MCLRRGQEEAEEEEGGEGEREKRGMMVEAVVEQGEKEKTHFLHDRKWLRFTAPPPSFSSSSTQPPLIFSFFFEEGSVR